MSGAALEPRDEDGSELVVTGLTRGRRELLDETHERSARGMRPGLHLGARYRRISAAFRGTLTRQSFRVMRRIL